LNDLDSVKALITDETAAIIIEPVLGEGGMKLADPEFLRALRNLCDEHDMLLFFDEIQCGMGRTGRLFAHEWSGVTPDVMCTAKALGNGYPIGACLATAKAAQGMVVGTHGSTYGGNPLAMAVGNAVLDVIAENDFLRAVVHKGGHLRKGLEGLIAKYPKIYTGIRGQGLILGIVCGPTNTQIVQALTAEKLLTVAAAENVIRLLPPLIVSETQIDEALAILDKVAAQIGEKL
jgi:acetylornithine/N-succinyldiaminopimelate aminotransferase